MQAPTVSTIIKLLGLGVLVQTGSAYYGVIGFALIALAVKVILEVWLWALEPNPASARADVIRMIARPMRWIRRARDGCCGVVRNRESSAEAIAAVMPAPATQGQGAGHKKPPAGHDKPRAGQSTSVPVSTSVVILPPIIPTGRKRTVHPSL
jgi:hypothetical protein